MRGRARGTHRRAADERHQPGSGGGVDAPARRRRGLGLDRGAQRRGWKREDWSLGGGAERWTGDGYRELEGLRLAGRRRTRRVSQPTRAVCVGPSYAASVPPNFRTLNKACLVGFLKKWFSHKNASEAMFRALKIHNLSQFLRVLLSCHLNILLIWQAI